MPTGALRALVREFYLSLTVINTILGNKYTDRLTNCTGCCEVG